jgi:hypothetical protein
MSPSHDMLSAEGLLMPTRKDQAPPPDLRYLKNYNR